MQWLLQRPLQYSVDKNTARESGVFDFSMKVKP